MNIELKDTESKEIYKKIEDHINAEIAAAPKNNPINLIRIEKSCTMYGKKLSPIIFAFFKTKKGSKCFRYSWSLGLSEGDEPHVLCILDESKCDSNMKKHLKHLDEFGI